MKISHLAVLLFVAAPPLLRADEPLDPMKFNQVREIAPGVFFRYSSISATDKTIPFGGSNNIWVVFKDYVVVYDANFPKEAGDVIEAIKKTTDKPIRYVMDSHHHGDHAYGNAVWAKAGATILSSAKCAELLRTKGPTEFEKEGKGATGRKDVAASTLRVPDLFFDDKLVLDDDTQRAEFHFLGHAHTAGDAVMYLPKFKILCTGDACVNGAFNFMGHSDSASWVRVLDKMQKFDVKLVCPGHGMVAGPDLLKTQQRYFVDLREQVKKAIDAGKDFEDVVAAIDMPWQKKWTGLDMKDRKDNIRHVFDELTGRVAPANLLEEFGLTEGPSPTKASPGWKAPKKIIVPPLMPTRVLELKRIAPDVLFIPVRDAAEAAKEAGDADAVVGFCSGEIVNVGKSLRWIQTPEAGFDQKLSPLFAKSPVTITDMGGELKSVSRATISSAANAVGSNPESVHDRRWRLVRENVRRFVAGEPLLCVVDKERGY